MTYGEIMSLVALAFLVVMLVMFVRMRRE